MDYKEFMDEFTPEQIPQDSEASTFEWALAEFAKGIVLQTFGGSELIKAHALALVEKASIAVSEMHKELPAEKKQEKVGMVLVALEHSIQGFINALILK